MIDTLKKIVIPQAPYINRFPLGDSNKTDWRGLEQYINYLYGENDSDREYALREVGNIFPKWVKIEPYKRGDMPPYIPRVKDMVAVQYMGYDAWHPVGLMSEEERMAVLKRRTSTPAWLSVSDDQGFNRYSGGQVPIKWAKYYDGVDWITYFTLVPSGIMPLFTSDPTGWTNRSGTLQSYWLYMLSSTGTTGGSTSHSHVGSNAIVGEVSTSTRVSIDTYVLGLSCGSPTHTHSGGSHTAATNTYYPAACSYRAFEAPTNANLVIPSGTICFWSGTTSNIPSGWTYVSTNNGGYYIRISSTGTGSNGSGVLTQGHPASGTSGSASSGSTSNLQSGSISCTDANYSHVHGYASTSHSNAHAHSSVVPAYFGVILMSADADTGELPVSGVSTFWSAPGTILGTSWTRVSAADDTYLMPDSTYGSTGGSLSHTHDHTGAESGNSSTPSNARTSGAGVTTIRAPHTHDLSSSSDHAATSSDNSMGPYYSVLLYSRGS